MSGPDALLALGVAPDSIWGDDDETIVYAQVLAEGKTVIFRFYLDPDSPPQSLTSQIVNLYHDNEAEGVQAAFEDRAAMRQAIWSSIASVWSSCARDPAVFVPGTVVNMVLGDTVNAGVTWNASRDQLYDTYLGLLGDVAPADLVPAVGHGAAETPVISITDVLLVEGMGGKGCSKHARVGSAAYAFKGVDFQTFLQVHDDDDEFTRAIVSTWVRSSRLIAGLPTRHPHIQSPPQLLVSTPSADGGAGAAIIIGHLSAFLPKGDLSNAIEAANAAGTRIALRLKARWCLYMARALQFTHHTMHTFHMDIKPGNFLIDDADQLVLIDWEQSGAPPTTLAPEADGTWDVAADNDDGGSGGGKLVYTKYTGPERRNMPEGSGPGTFNQWNVFPVWQASCPRATELAEVFAVGRTMWMLLSQTSQDFDDVKHPDDVNMTWEDAEDIPASWIENVMQCMARDPNDRPMLDTLVTFWESASASVA